MNIQLTDSAARHVSNILQKNPDAVGLRVGVKPAGCAEFSYVIDVAKSISDADEVAEIKGVKLVVNKESLEKIDGMEIDYKQEGLNSNIVFNNPKAVHSCGCGESFSLK